MMKDPIVQQVLEKYVQRSDVGMQKYGTTLGQNNKDSYLKHLQEELMDATLYIEKEMSLNKEMRRLVDLYSNDQELGAAIRKLVS